MLSMDLHKDTTKKNNSTQKKSDRKASQAATYTRVLDCPQRAVPSVGQSSSTSVLTATRRKWRSGRAAVHTTNDAPDGHRGRTPRRRDMAGRSGDILLPAEKDAPLQGGCMQVVAAAQLNCVKRSGCTVVADPGWPTCRQPTSLPGRRWASRQSSSCSPARTA